MDTDRIEISTPEGLNLEMTLAGLGSRAAAAIVDTLIIALLILVVELPFRNSTSTPVRIFQIAVPFLLFFGFHMLFETVGNRQSPGKRLLGLQVVKVDGSPAGGLDSVIRNLVRLVDFLPVFYLIGMITVFSTSRNQRLGDLAAGVVVVTEPKPVSTLASDFLPPAFELPEGWDTSAVTDRDMAVMRQFLIRRDTLDRLSRGNLAGKIASSLENKVSYPRQMMSTEKMIETVYQLKKHRE